MQSNREVAAGIVNLGNTCYINAVLQALAHAPELCMAIECEPHSPILHSEKLLQDTHVNTNANGNSNSNGNCGSANDTTNDEQTNIDDTTDNEMTFNLLNELEKHLIQVHEAKTGNGTSVNGAVEPATFVNGFIDHVAPSCFKLGVQEDSHEFLRLLIEGMQMCCMDKENANEHDQNNGANGATRKDTKALLAKKKDKMNDYSFRLFSGKVQSVVNCSNCNANSSTIDPIEDIGLEVTSSTPYAQTSSSRSYGRGTSSVSTSPTPSSLSDVTAALEKFVATEYLDSGYKCESCGKVGRATKQSRLASIPPILTLHLKRFRYGNDKPLLAPLPSRRRSSELSSLMGGVGDVGKSGSAKIEGHVKFEQVFDIRPYLTKEKQKEVKSMLCRLFAVIVHTGKNSHSGHYICYVRNVAKNEWWKMDDARVARVSREEVVAAEAYMLFYSVMDHPVSVELRNKEKAHKEKLAEKEANEEAERLLQQQQLEEEESQKQKEQEKQQQQQPVVNITDQKSNTNGDTNTKETSPDKGIKRKREEPEFKSGEEWARKMTTNPNSLLSTIREAQDLISELIEFKPEYLRCIKDEAESLGKTGSGPTIGVSLDDLKDATLDEFRHAILKLFQNILPTDDKPELDSLLKPKGKVTSNEVKEKKKEEDKKPNLIIPVVEGNDTLI